MSYLSRREVSKINYIKGVVDRLVNLISGRKELSLEEIKELKEIEYNVGYFSDVLSRYFGVFYRTDDRYRSFVRRAPMRRIDTKISFFLWYLADFIQDVLRAIILEGTEKAPTNRDFLSPLNVLLDTIIDMRSTFDIEEERFSKYLDIRKKVKEVRETPTSEEEIRNVFISGLGAISDFLNDIVRKSEKVIRLNDFCYTKELDDKFSEFCRWFTNTIETLESRGYIEVDYLAHVPDMMAYNKDIIGDKVVFSKLDEDILGLVDLDKLEGEVIGIIDHEMCEIVCDVVKEYLGTSCEYTLDSYPRIILKGNSLDNLTIATVLTHVASFIKSRMPVDEYDAIVEYVRKKFGIEL